MATPTNPSAQEYAALRQRRRDQAAHTAATSAARKNPRPKQKPPAKPPTKLYDWGDGRKVHTRPGKTPHKPTSPTTPTPPADPASITAPLTPEQLDTEAAAAIRARYGGTEREIAGQQRVSDQMQTNIGGWFDEYKADVEAARQRTADFNTGVQAAQAAQANTAATADAAIATTPEAQQAAAARRSTSNSFGSMLAAQSGAENAYQADKGRIGGGEAVHQHLAEAGRKRSLGEDLKALKGEEGDFEVGYRADARAAERKNELERKAFDLDVASASDKATEGYGPGKSGVNKYTFTYDEWRALSEADRKKYRDGTNKPKDAPTGYGPGGPGQNKYGYTYDQWNALSPADQDKKRAGKGPAKPKERGPTAADIRAENKRIEDNRDKSNTGLNRIDTARGLWDSLKNKRITTGEQDGNGHDKVDGQGRPLTRPITEADKRDELAKAGYSPNEIHLMLTKKWGPAEVAMARQLGIKYIPRSRLAYDPDLRAGSNKDPKPQGSQGGLGGK